jgi:membrane associated rhomboid family serine protease
MIAETPGNAGITAVHPILGCYMRLFPQARVIVMVPVIFIPLLFALPGAVFVGLWFLMRVL